MLLIEISIEEFIRRTVMAAERCEYAAVGIVVARSADEPDLLSAVARDWESLHSVTGDLIAIACPRPNALPSERGSYMPNTSRYARGEALGVHGFGVALANSRPDTWERAFWDGDVVPPAPPAARRPLAPTEIGLGGTEAVEQIKHMFGLPEEAVPCIVVLSMWERRLIVVPVAPSAEPYALFKRLLAVLTEQSRTIEALRSEWRLLADAAAGADRLVQAARRRADGERRHWENRVSRFASALRAVGVNLPEPPTTLRNAWQVPAPALAELQRIEVILSAMPARQDDRLIATLDSLRRQIGAGLPTVVESVKAAEAAGAGTNEAARRLRAIQEHLDQVKRSLRLAEALGSAVQPRELRRVGQGGIKPPPDWTADVLGRIDADAAIPTSPTRN